MDSLVERILGLSRDPRLRTDRIDYNIESFPPVGIEQIGSTESALGFELPQLLRDLYQQVGNGGFGPGCGIISLEGGYENDISEMSLPELYEVYRGLSQEAFPPPWPEKLLPLFVMGGARVDSVDCSVPGSPIVVVDEEQLNATGISFHDRMEQWADRMEARQKALGAISVDTSRPAPY